MAGQRWKCLVAYDGTGFDGWQSQPGGQTIQDILEKRLATLFGRRIPIHGSGRTDSGVHARGQVFHFDADWPHGPEKLIRAFRSGVPKAIQVYAAEEVDGAFHARFSAIRKRYVYQFFEGFPDPFHYRYFWSLGNRRLDTGLMQAAAAQLVGCHDFASFSANPGEEREEGTVRHLMALDVRREGPVVRLVAEADGFLFRMVRSLAGCLADVGTGRLPVELMGQLLEERKRTHQVQTAPAEGLFLEAVDYGM
jgi:tRNA pseudouridine38-40 synthase